ncbi:MAG: serine hydrolase domain-containing protein [Gammaproteobacteria bacterium]|nr:beta-lactamase family protein [Pseudomonadales bacterium]
MKSPLCSLLLSLVLSTLPAILFAQPRTLVADPLLQERIYRYLVAHEVNNDFMGEVLVADSERILARVLVGMADIESGRPHRPGDVYGVASVTKQFTGAAIALLVSRGVLSLDDSVADWLPTFTTRVSGMEHVTIRMLAQQEAGVPDYNDFPDYAQFSRRQVNLDEVLDWIAQNTSSISPGTGYDYSNSHFAILARIIEEASGESYRQFMREHIFNPAGMLSSGHYRAEEIVMQRVSLYDPGQHGDLVNAPVLDNSMKLGSGSLYTTADDLLSWHRSLLKERVLNAQTQELYLEPSGERYAMGVGVRMDALSNQLITDHDGKAPGIAAYYKRWLGDGKVLILLSNVNSGVLNQMKSDLSHLIAGEEVAMPQKREYREIEKALLTEAPGNYLFPPTTPIRIAQELDGLSLYWRESGLVQHLAPLADSDWFLMGSRGDKVRFHRNPDGEIDGMEYDWGGGFEFCPLQKRSVR